MVCILTLLTTYKFFWSKITASCVVMYVTLIRLPFKYETCDLYHLLLADMCIFLIFFEVGIPNLVFKCILGWGSVTYHFRVTVTLTSDLVLLIIVPGAYLLYY